MALFINGVGQDSFSMNGVTIDNLYVDSVLVWSSVVDTAPNAPTNFIASDDEEGQITFTWDNSTIGYPIPIYDIRIHNGDRVAADVTSPYTLSFNAGTADFIVRALNTEGTADSNVDSGTSVSPPSELPPIYELTEPLIDWGGFNWLVNSAEGQTTYNGKLLQSNGVDAWYPTAQEYIPSEARIDFSTNYADTEWTPYPSSEYIFTFIEDVVIGSSYSMVSINPKGDGLTADVLYDGVLAVEDTGLNYTPPTESVKITENMTKQIVPMIPICAITMSQYTFGVGDTATVTFTWNTVPTDFLLNNIISQNGGITNLSQDSNNPWIYTATFTPNEGVDDDTNVLRINGSLSTILDDWDNATNIDFVSDNYIVDTASAPSVLNEYNVAFSSGTPSSPAPVDIFITNQIGTGGPFALPNIDNVDDGLTYAVTGSAMGLSTSGVIEGSDNGPLYDMQLAEYLWRDGNNWAVITLPRTGTFVIRVSASTTSTNVNYETAGYSMQIDAGAATWPEADLQEINAKLATEYAEWTLDVTQADTQAVIVLGAGTGGRGILGGIRVKEMS